MSRHDLVRMIIREVFLTESKIDDLKAKNPDWSDTIDIIANRDPTPQKKYVEWGFKQFMSADVTPAHVGDVIRSFHQRVNRLPEKDINKYPSIESVEKVIAEIEPSKTQKIKSDKKKNADVIFENESILIVHPKTESASNLYGAGTKWCISATRTQNYFEEYTQNGAIFFFIISKSEELVFEKIAIAMTISVIDRDGEISRIPESAEKIGMFPVEIFDEKDTQVSLSEFDALTGSNSSLIKEKILSSKIVREESIKIKKIIDAISTLQSRHITADHVLQIVDEMLQIDEDEQPPQIYKIFELAAKSLFSIIKSTFRTFDSLTRQSDDDEIRIPEEIQKTVKTVISILEKSTLVSSELDELGRDIRTSQPQSYSLLARMVTPEMLHDMSQSQSSRLLSVVAMRSHESDDIARVNSAIAKIMSEHQLEGSTGGMFSSIEDDNTRHQLWETMTALFKNYMYTPSMAKKLDLTDDNIVMCMAKNSSDADVLSLISSIQSAWQYLVNNPAVYGSKNQCNLIASEIRKSVEDKTFNSETNDEVLWNIGSSKMIDKNTSAISDEGRIDLLKACFDQKEWHGGLRILKHSDPVDVVGSPLGYEICLRGMDRLEGSIWMDLLRVVTSVIETNGVSDDMAEKFEDLLREINVKSSWMSGRRD